MEDLQERIKKLQIENQELKRKLEIAEAQEAIRALASQRATEMWTERLDAAMKERDYYKSLVGQRAIYSPEPETQLLNLSFESFTQLWNEAEKNIESGWPHND